MSFLVPRHHLKCQKKRLSAKCILFSAFYFSWLGFTCEFFFYCVDKICVASFSQNCTNVFPIPLCAQKCYSWPVLKTRTNDFYFKDIVPIKFADESLLEKEIIDDGQIHCCVCISFVYGAVSMIYMPWAWNAKCWAIFLQSLELLYLTRLETRAKESNMRANLRLS